MACMIALVFYVTALLLDVAHVIALFIDIIYMFVPVTGNTWMIALLVDITCTILSLLMLHG